MRLTCHLGSSDKAAADSTNERAVPDTIGGCESSQRRMNGWRTAGGPLFANSGVPAKLALHEKAPHLISR
jgi:hypothetical protein